MANRDRISEDEEHERHIYPVLTFYRALQRFLSLREDKKEQLSSYENRFANILEKTKCSHKHAIKYELKMMNISEDTPEDDPRYETARRKLNDSLIACAYIYQAHKKYTHLQIDLENSFMSGRDCFPKDLNAAHRMMYKYILD